MDYINQLKQKVKTGEHVFIAPGAQVLGDVTIGNQSSVWFNAVIRGDYDKVTIGERSNIQDCAVVHVDENIPTIIGNDVTVGHSAIVHGAVIGDNTLIGMHATVLNNVKIGKYCIIGANALVTEGTEIPDYSLVLGSPGKVMRQLNKQQIKAVEENARTYVDMAARYLNLAEV